MNGFERIPVEPRPRPADGNIIRHYAIEQAEWIWLHDTPAEPAYFAEMDRIVELDEPVETVIHVSADERYELYWNDQLVSRGPDRCDLHHWSFASYRVRLPAGRHRFRVFLTVLGKEAPTAQVSHQPGFILAAEGLKDTLSTGHAAWRGRWLPGISLLPALTGVYHVIGPGFVVDAARHFADHPWGGTRTVFRLRDGSTGIVATGPILHPSRLPDQLAGVLRPARFRSVMEGLDNVPWQAAGEALAGPWKALESGGAVEVGPGQEVRVLFDLEDYYCGYSQLTVEGGAGAEIALDWAESLFENPDWRDYAKGNRDDWLGKYFHGFGDRFQPDGPRRDFRSYWWRSGRYLELRIRTADTPVRILDLAIGETRYPAAFGAGFSCSDPEIEACLPMMVRGLEACAHETFVDCPYYEQMCYVGDTRLQALCWLVLGRDDRLVKRCIELYDWSRWKTGYVAERYPSDPFQLSVTFSMIWVLMLADYAAWRNDPAFVRGCLPGMRSLIDTILQNRNADGLIERLPGWTFIDWVRSWDQGVPPGGREGSTATVDLQFLLALRAARSLEQALGDSHMAERWDRLAMEHARLIHQHYWDNEAGLYTDLPGDATHFSLHAQCHAVIAGLLSAEEGRKLMERGMQREGIAWPTPYFQYYYFEALTRVGLEDRLIQELDTWKAFPKQGLRTPPETEDPTRSDCHAWGSHPLYHLHASVAGIRPLSSGMSRLRVAPQPGGLESLRSEVPVEGGSVVVDLRFRGSAVSGSVSMPESLAGEFAWGNTVVPLEAGEVTQIALPS